MHKLLAAAGIGSRREIESWVADGRLKVDGQTAITGQKITGAERLSLDGKPLRITPPETHAHRVIAYHKPEGQIVSRHDPEGRATVFKALPRVTGARWVAIGRLDINTSGLLLFTTDGQLAHRLMHPSTQVEREYATRVLGEVDANTLDALLKGVLLEDGTAKFESIKSAGGQGANHWYHVVLREGRNREVRRLWESQNVTVSRLIRIRYGPIALGQGLKRGHHRELDTREMKQLYAATAKP
ncbi:MAG TPA: pseudouridine synthase [Gammaproteobacteria bacterium]|nr:pseudouridine synthase [Gammaproteobacteria bacterium]